MVFESMCFVLLYTQKVQLHYTMSNHCYCHHIELMMKHWPTMWTDGYLRAHTRQKYPKEQMLVMAKEIYITYIFDFFIHIQQDKNKCIIV